MSAPLNDYNPSRDSTPHVTDICKGKKKIKKLKKSIKQHRKKYLKATYKAAERLNEERERRYQAEADLKCAVFLLNVMAQGRQIPLPDLSQDGEGGGNP